MRGSGEKGLGGGDGGTASGKTGSRNITYWPIGEIPAACPPVYLWSMGARRPDKRGGAQNEGGGRERARGANVCGARQPRRGGAHSDPTATRRARKRGADAAAAATAMGRAASASRAAMAARKRTPRLPYDTT